MYNNNFNARTDKPELFGPPLTQQKDDYLEIRLPKYLRDQGWANGIGFVQNEIDRRAAADSNISREVAFDFMSCRWIDPLPLMSILLEVITARNLGMKVIICLPESDAGPNSDEKGPYQESPNRLLLFLAQGGFLDCLDNLKDAGICYSSKPDGGWDVYRNLQVPLSYEDAQCIPMLLFLVPTEGKDREFPKKSMEDILVGIDSKLESKVAPQVRERLIYKLRVAIQEILHNVQEHAYDTEDAASRPIVIYMRYRTGGLGLDSTGRQIILECIKEENKHCPRLEEEWLTVKLGCLELFVLDRGIGIVGSFEKAGVPLQGKYKFREVMHKTFKQGHSTKPERQTLYGGLHLLHNLLEGTRDYIRALEDGIWFGCGVPFIRETTATHTLTESQNRMKGLAMHLRFGWKVETDVGEDWAKFEKPEQDNLWSELKLDENACASSFSWFETQPIIDERFGDFKIYGTQGEVILWLVKSHRMKWDILTFIERNVTPLSSGNSVLIIGDIPSYEAKTYAAALSEFKALGTSNWPAKFSYIILFTNRWRFAIVKYQKYYQQHGFSSLHKNFDKLGIPSLPIEPKPAKFRLAIVRWLKWHDSRRLWNEVNQHRQMFIPEQVSWGKNETGETRNIPGYLDFPKTIHNSLCMAIYRTALSRVLGILFPGNIEIHPLDRLSASVLRDVHAIEMYETTNGSPETRLALGSILVTGSTLKAFALSNLDLHFFIHCSSPLRGKNSSLLYWLPNAHISNTRPRFARIGRTSSIAPEGWKSFEVPRFDAQEKCVGARSPHETYQDWQSLSPVILKAGHWSYEGHHDFLSVNVVSAVEVAFLGKNDLARFLTRSILSFIGINEKHVNVNYQRLLTKSPDSTLDKAIDPTNYGLLVYRSHSSSESIISTLLDILTPEGRELALSRIFPILPVRTRWSGSTFLMPPLVREDIKAALNTGSKPHPILLFDDATITGRTIQDLRSALGALGATKISTVVILNRLRQPAHGVENELLSYYWQLDVPVMGHEGNCPLCHTLNLAEAFSNLLASTNAKNEIIRWKCLWGETSPLDNWSAGLRPLPLGTPEIGKGYCYRQNAINKDEKHLARIDLIRSTGLSINVTELHAMTGRDDYCLKKIKEHNEPEIRVELAASQILLFGNEFDLDIRVELIKILIREAAFLQKDSPHASLAGLVIIREFRLLDEKSKKDSAGIVNEKGWRQQSNYVIKILQAYFVSEKLIKEGSEAYKIGKRLLTTASLSLPQRFNALFLETLSPLGNAHSEAIPFLVNELTNGTLSNDEWINDAMDSLDFLVEICNNLDPNLVRDGEKESYYNKLNDIKTSYGNARQKLVEGIEKGKDETWHQDTKSILLDFLDNMKALAEFFFHRIPLAEEYYKDKTFETNVLSQTINRIDWEEACAGKSVCKDKRIIKFDLLGEIDFDCNAKEVWIPWHRFIARIVVNLLKNAVYAQNKITNPWNSFENELADLWVHVDYRNELLELTLANASTCDHKDIFSKMKKKRWTYLIDLGGEINTIALSENIIGIQVKIPYAAYLGMKME